MTIDKSNMSMLDRLQTLSDDKKKAYMNSLTDVQVVNLMHDIEFLGRPKQIVPKGDWDTLLVLAGRGFGKTYMAAHAVNNWARDIPKCRIALVGETTKDVREVIVKGESGILNQSHPDFKPTFNMANGILTYPNGSTCQCFSAEDPDQLRGPNFHFALLDELAKYRYQEDVWDMLQFCLRLGDHPQVIVTTTPRPTRLIKQLTNDPTTKLITGSTFENTTLPDKFIEKMRNKYEGTRLGEQELFAKILDDNPNALFNNNNIDEPRIRYDSHINNEKSEVFYRKIVDSMDRIVVAIDPAITSNPKSDETGIIICGKKGDQGYVIGDASLIGTPQQWAAAAVFQYKHFGADRIVAEVNQGGDMVESTIRNVDKLVPYKAVRASKGKALRAEPIAALYEQHRIHHLGYFPDLEAQMIDFDPTLGQHQDSPDRMDALVYAFTELFGIEIAEPRILFI